MLRSMVTRCLGFRSLHTTQALRINPKTVEEVRIPVPWGHIAGKWWGSKEGRPLILAIHGWQDNAGSWDPVCERIPDEYSVLAVDLPGKWWGSSEEQPILALHGLFDNAASFDLLAPCLNVPALLALDLPGHGRSSHFPKGMCWNWSVMMSSVRYLIKHHFKWSSISLLGHSYGSCLALTYAGLYPKETQTLITIDCARAANAMDDYVSTWRKNTERLLSLESKNPALKPLTYVEALNKMSTRKFPLTTEQCQIIASRGLSNIGCGKYIFNEDLRMSSPSIGRNSLEGFDALVDNITCNVLNIVATDGLLIGEFMATVKKHDEVMKQKCAHFECQVIIGRHHVHMDNPEEVATAINKFLESRKPTCLES